MAKFEQRQLADMFEVVKDLQKKLNSLREFCHKADYDIYDWEVKNIEEE